MIFLAENNQDGNAEFSRKEFGALEKDFGDMGSGERKVLNNDFLTAVFGTDDVVITTEGNKQTFKTSDGKFLGTVEQDENTFKFFDKDGNITSEVIRTDDSLITTTYNSETQKPLLKITQQEGSKVTEQYDSNGNLKEKTTEWPGLGTMTETQVGPHERTVEYKGDVLIARMDGIVKESYYNTSRVKRVDYADGRVEYFRRNSPRDEYELDEQATSDANRQITNPKTPAEASNAQQKVNPETPAGTQNTQQVVNSETKTPNFTDSLQQFGNKVTIDENVSAQRLSSDKQWETSVRVPQRATTGENGAPSEIQIKLPSSYGDNQYQTLKLIDPENNIYQDRSGVRKFQVNIAEDGITLKHIEINDANTRAFVEANKPVENTPATNGTNPTENTSATKDPNPPTQATGPKKNKDGVRLEYDLPTWDGWNTSFPENAGKTYTEPGRNGLIYCKYDKNGYLVELAENNKFYSIKRGDEGQIFEFTIEYKNSYGNKVQITYVPPNGDEHGRLRDYTICYYDDEGNQIGELRNTSGGDFLETYIYDKNGNIIEEGLSKEEFCKRVR